MTNKNKQLKTQSLGDKPITAIFNDCKTVRGDNMNTLSYISSESEEEAEKRQCIEDTKYFIQCKQDDIDTCYDYIEDINVEVKEMRTKINDLIFAARNNGLAIVKLRDDKEWLENDLHALQCEPDEDMGRYR